MSAKMWRLFYPLNFFEGAGIFPANPIISARTSAMMQGGDRGAGNGDRADAAQWKMYWPGPDGYR